MTSPTADRPLAGLRVLSLAEQYPGPLATMLLADLGADVILVERPGTGDPSRRFAGHFAALNRNKRSVALDLKSAAGKSAFAGLLDTADVLVEGFRPGVMARLGFGPEEMARSHPELVYASISAFGQSGAFSHLSGHDLSVQGVAGLLDPALGTKPGGPLPVLPLADIASGMFAALGIVSMLLGRARGGPVGALDISMLDSLLFWIAPLSLPRANGMQAAPLPPLEPAYGVFRSLDGKDFTLSIAGEDHLWAALCKVLELEAMAGLSEDQRVAGRDSIGTELREALGARRWDWIEPQLAMASVPFAPICSLDEITTDPRFLDRGLYTDLAGSTGRPELHARQPIRVQTSAAPAPLRPVPALGEHTDEILGPQ